MTNTCKDYIKKNKKIIFQDIKDFENKLIFEEKPINNYDDIEYILNLLTEKEKNLIVMRYIDDMSFKDIAKSCSSPIGTIKSNISRSIKKLKFYLKGANA